MVCYLSRLEGRALRELRHREQLSGCHHTAMIQARGPGAWARVTGGRDREVGESKVQF